MGGMKGGVRIQWVSVVEHSAALGDVISFSNENLQLTRMSARILPIAVGKLVVIDSPV
jgi:hypothetical protein